MLPSVGARREIEYFYDSNDDGDDQEGKSYMSLNIHIQDYYNSVCEAYRLGNIESSYNAPIIALLTQFGCIARDMSGERSGQTGENIDIKLWHGDEEITEAEPFAGVEAKKVEGIDARALKNIKIEAVRYGNAILTDNLVWQFWRSGEDKMYTGVQLIERNGDKLVLRKDNIELFVSLVEDFLLRDPAQIRSSNKLAEYGYARSDNPQRHYGHT